jgi:SAM-dependent methyltransferase
LVTARVPSWSIAAWPVVVWPLLVGLALRVAWALYAARSVPEFLVSGDQYSYWIIGQEIGAGRGYRIPPFTDPTSYYPVGFPALLGLAAFITTRTPLPDDPVSVMAAIQVFAGVAAIALTHVVALRTWGPRVAIVAAWIVAAWPNLVMSVATYSVEPVFIALCLGVLAVVVTHDWSTGRVPSTGRLVAFGALLGAAVLVRPFVLPVVLGLALACWVVGAGWRATLRTVAIPVVVVAVMLVPWTVRNAVTLGAFVPISTNLGDTVCMDRTLEANGTFRFAVHDGCADPELPEAERNRANLREAASFVVNHPVKEVHLWGMRVYRMMIDDRVALREVEELGAGRFLDDRVRSGLGVLADSWFFAVGTLAVVGAARRRRELWSDPARAIVLVTAVGLLLIPIGLWGAPRFHVPLAPFMAIAAGLALAPRRSVRGMDADAWDERYAGSDLVWSADANRFVVEVVAGWPPGRAVDLACGEGRNAIWLAQQGWEVTAVDFSTVAVERGRRLADAAGVEIEWVCADATIHRAEAGTLDLALVCYLQLPSDQLRTVLVHARQALAPGGAVVVIAHALENLEHGVGGPQDPSVLPTVEQVVGALDGLVVERGSNVTRPVTTADGERDAIDLVVVARRPR